MDAKSTYVHKFKETFTYEDKKYDELVFDFGKLKGRDIIAVQNEMISAGTMSISPELQSDFQAKIAARAANIGSDLIESLSVRDFMIITGKARSFLLDTNF